jgi:hypothetical protein
MLGDTRTSGIEEEWRKKSAMRWASRFSATRAAHESKNSRLSNVHGSWMQNFK